VGHVPQHAVLLCCGVRSCGSDAHARGFLLYSNSCIFPRSFSHSLPPDNTLEGCDHWEIRAARGLELGIDGSMLSSLASSMPGVSLKDWDWSDFLGAWCLSGDARKADAVRVNVDTKSGTIEAGSGANGKQETDGQSSMETLSAVFDWVAEHVPTEAVTKLTSRVPDVVGANSTLEEVEAAKVPTARVSGMNLRRKRT
jgi:hypothetical protein